MYYYYLDLYLMHIITINIYLSIQFFLQCTHLHGKRSSKAMVMQSQRDGVIALRANKKGITQVAEHQLISLLLRK